MTMLVQVGSTPARTSAAICHARAAERRDSSDPRRTPTPQERRADRAILAIFVEAASALITQLMEVGISDHADIARRLNRRGFPCWRRPRWTAGAVAGVMRRKARLDESL